MIVVLFRVNVFQYQVFKQKIDNLVGCVNGEYGNFGWVFIQYFYCSLDFGDLIIFYKVVDIVLIMFLCDGMNFVVKEFIVSKEVFKKGVFIFSEMVGVYNEFYDSIMVNL